MGFTMALGSLGFYNGFRVQGFRGEDDSSLYGRL